MVARIQGGRVTTVASARGVFDVARAAANAGVRVPRRRRVRPLAPLLAPPARSGGRPRRAASPQDLHHRRGTAERPHRVHPRRLPRLPLVRDGRRTRAFRRLRFSELRSARRPADGTSRRAPRVARRRVLGRDDRGPRALRRFASANAAGRLRARVDLSRRRPLERHRGPARRPIRRAPFRDARGPLPCRAGLAGPGRRAGAARRARPDGLDGHRRPRRGCRRRPLAGRGIRALSPPRPAARCGGSPTPPACRRRSGA